MLNLDKEQQTYDSELVNMLKGQGEGQFVVVRGDSICKFEPTYEQALSWGYAQFGLEPFMVKQVTALEPEVFFSRYAGLCAGRAFQSPLQAPSYRSSSESSRRDARHSSGRVNRYR